MLLASDGKGEGGDLGGDILRDIRHFFDADVKAPRPKRDSLADVTVQRQQVLSGERVLGAFRKEDAEFYHNTTWRIMNYSREAFKYEGFIESSKNQAFMSE